MKKGEDEEEEEEEETRKGKNRTEMDREKGEQEWIFIVTTIYYSLFITGRAETSLPYRQSLNKIESLPQTLIF